MAKNLIDWASEQSAWVSDSLRRIAVAADHSIDDEDLACIIANIRRVAVSTEAADGLEFLDASHLGAGSHETRRTVLTQLGPVQHIDRLAGGQRLRMAIDGITLIYGENGSGKSGYTRIAKRLCRSLSVDQLRGNVFAASTGPKRVEVKYRVGDDEVRTLDWDPDTAPPPVLQQISVFDSHNARLYVDGENRIAYLPRELAILEHHGSVCLRVAQMLNVEEKVLAGRLKVPLPAGYSAGTSVSLLLEKLNLKNATCPADSEFVRLSEMSEAERAELAALELELASDPVAQAAIRQRAIAVLRRIGIVFAELSVSLSDAVGKNVADARIELHSAVDAERIAAAASFVDEPIDNVGGPAWRILFEAARAFAASEGEPSPNRLPETAGDFCLLCLEPLSPAGADRLKRFNDFVSGEASRRADRARASLKALHEAIERIAVPAGEVVEGSLSGYSQLSLDRSALTSQITSLLADFASMRTALMDQGNLPLKAPDLTHISLSIVQEIDRLDTEVTELEQMALHNIKIDTKRALLANLKDRVKLRDDLETVLQRCRDLRERKSLSDCLAQVATRPISDQISALRRLLVTKDLEKRLVDEIAAFGLSHLPFKISDNSSAGKSLFSVGLMGVVKVKNNQILSEGEQRALALACFLAEIGGDDARYGIIVDDPVSSLDHIRMRKVAHRLVVEAKKGRQIIIFTHNLVFFNELVSEAARAGDSAPLIKSVVSQTSSDGFGVITENSEPWVADLSSRIVALSERARLHLTVTDFDSDDYRRKVKDFYSDLRESWERAVEELVLAKTIVRFVPDVMTGRLKEVNVTDEDYRTIFFAMKKASERSGHDMSAGRNVPPPTPDEMVADVKALDDFRIDYNRRKKITSSTREALEKPRTGKLV